MSVRYPKSLKALMGSAAAIARSHVVNGESVLREVATDLFESLATPVSLSCEILLRYGELEQLVRKSLDPLDYNDAFRFRDDYQAISFLRKAPLRIKGVDPKAEAKRKFLEAEVQCRVTNSRVRSFLANPNGYSGVVREAFCLAGVKIQEVLGHHVFVREWLNSCRFGPGTFNSPLARGLTSVYDKLQVTPTVTHDFRDTGAMLVTSSPSWARSVTDSEIEGFWPFVSGADLHPVPGNRVTFVPKTATTERAIAIEPLVNIYAQLGLGAMIRKRLNAFAFIDLNDQAVNQQLAREGSIRGNLATVDLSSASDTVSKEVVRALLPEGWFRVLDLVRSKVGTLDGTPFVYEKFSSMGNGFTFELESLIFWALASSACVIAGAPEMVSVYGDDIIVPVEAYDTLEEILTFFGFSFNRKKSFKLGVFRESCGKDYYEGVEVRPFLQEDVPQQVKDLFSLANGLRRTAFKRNGNHYGCDVRLERPWRRTVSKIPSVLAKHLRVPAHAGDSEGLISSWDEAQASSFVTLSRGWQGWWGLRLAPVPVEAPKSTNFNGGAASLLYRSRDGFGDDYSPVDPRLGRDVVFEVKGGAFWGPWTELGGWF